MHDERGGVIVSGLLRTVGWLVLFCVIAFDAGGIITNRVLLDEAVQVAARQAAAEVAVSVGRASSLQATARETAEESLQDQPGVELVDVRLVEWRVEVTARRHARVLLADRIPRVRDLVEAEVTAQANARPE